jgi:hypothetical protein
VIELVSNNSDAAVARQRAKDQVEYRLREMAANLLRCVRGAGKPFELGRQAASFTAALTSYYETVGHYPPSDELSRLLLWDEGRKYEHPDSVGRHDAERRIIRGALQIVASELLGQLTQRSAGSDEMRLGTNDLIAWREDRRKQHAAEAKKHSAPSVRRGKRR